MSIRTKIDAERPYKVLCPFIVDSSEIRTNKGYETVVKNIKCKGRKCAAFIEHRGINGEPKGTGYCGAVKE